MPKDGGNSVVLYSEEGEEMVAVYSIKRNGDKLVIDGKALGAIRIDIILTRAQFFGSLKFVFSPAVVCFVLLLPYFSLISLMRTIGEYIKRGRKLKA